MNKLGSMLNYRQNKMILNLKYQVQKLFWRISYSSFNFTNEWYYMILLEENRQIRNRIYYRFEGDILILPQGEQVILNDE